MSPFTRLYYAVKPWLPVWLRFALRRRRARAIRRGKVHDWPINPAAAQPPAGWPGWPDGKKFAFVLTHDVEGPKGYVRIKELARLEQELGFRSSFNLIPEGPYRVEPELRQWLTDQGFEVGIHDLHHDGKLYRSREEFSRRAQKINRYLKEWNAVGFRSAYMLHNLDWLGELDVAYDASTFDTDPFEPQPDGVGTIFPFWVPRQSSQETGDRRQESEDGRWETGDAKQKRGNDTRNAHSALATDSPPPLRAGERAGVRCSQSAIHNPQSALSAGSSSSNSAAPFPLSALNSPLLKRSPLSDAAPSLHHSTTPFPLSAFSSPHLETSSGSSSQLSAFSSQLSQDGFVELPYTLAQDSTLFLILGEQGIDCWKEKVRWIADHGGMVLVNAHPDNGV